MCRTSYTLMAFRFAYVVACTTSLALVSHSAAAADPPAPSADAPKQPTKADLDEAQRRYQRGRELYDENDVNAALVEIRRAYDLAPSYKLLFDIGQICFQLQDYPCALRSFTKYLDDGKSDVAQARRTEVEADVEKLKGRVATLNISTTTPGAEIFVDDVSVGKTPLSAPVIVSAGKRRIAAKLPGAETVTKNIEVAGTDKLDVALEIGSVAAIPNVDKPAGEKPVDGNTAGSTTKFPVVPWVITGALGVGAGVAGALALSASSDYRTKLDTFGVTRAELDSAHSSTSTLAVVTDILLGATVVAAGTSLFLTVSGGSSSKKAAQLPVVVGVGPASVWVQGTF